MVSNNTFKIILTIASSEQMKYIWVTLLVVTLLNSTGNAARILGVFPYNGKSHFLMFEVLMKALSARGHEVEVVSHFPQKTPLANYTDISIEETLPPIMNNLPMDIVETFDSFSVVQFIVSENMKVCKKVIASPDIKKLLLNKHKYDLIVTETFGTDCLLGLIYKLQAPYISMISSVLQPWANDRVGNPDNPSYIPNYYLPYKASMNFFQRLKNAVFTIFINWYFYTYSVLPSDKLVQEHFGYDTPPIIKIANNVSLTLTNSHFSLNQARPMVPAVVEVGGIHLKVPGKLPKDIEKFIKESDDGVIYFSFGSMVQAETLPEDKLNSFLEVFEKLKQRVLWKCNPDKLGKLPPNVKAAKWLPQEDILAHPNVRLFITHGGLLGTQEAISSGVPLLGIPLFADQELNIENYVGEGMAIKLKYTSITKETLLTALETLLYNTSYRHNAKRMSKLFKDRPQTPIETAVFWAEYVIRHRGARHLRSAALDLAWYQYLLLDVFSFLVAISAVVTLLLLFVIRKLYISFNINFAKYVSLSPSKFKYH